MRIYPVKTAVDRFQIVGELGGYMEEMMKDLAPEICRLTSYAPIKIAQKGDMLLCNSGAYTTFLNLKKMESSREIMNMIVENVHKNNAVRILKNKPAILDRKV